MNKASGGDGIPVELFQILKDDAVKVPHSICQQIWKTQQWPQDWKRLVFIPIPKKGNAKESSNYHAIALISHASKITLKIPQVRLQQYVNHELPDVQTVFKRQRNQWSNCEHLLAYWKSNKVPEKYLLLLYDDNCFIDYFKAFDCVDHNKLWKILKEMEYQTTWPASWEICMQVKKQELEPYMEQQIHSKLGKEYVKAVYSYPAYLTYMQSTSCEVLGWMKHKLESRLLGEIPITSDMQMTSRLWQKAKN